MVRRAISLLRELSKKYFRKRRCASIQNEGKQCSRTTRFLGRYCWQHMPKAPLILTALLGLTTRELFHWAIPSEEKREIARSRDAVIDRLDVTSELGNEIQNLSVILVFREPLPAATLKDELILAFLRQEQSPFPYVEALGEVSRIGTGPNEASFSMFFYAKCSLDGRAPSGSNQGYSCASWEGTLSELPIPFSLSHAAQTPFRLVKDLEDCHIQVFVPPNIAQAIKRLDIVANTGWGMSRRLRLLSKEIQPSDWTETDYDVRLRFWRKGSEEKRRTASLKPSLERIDWRVAPREAVWEEHPKPFLEGFRVPYRFKAP